MIGRLFPQQFDNDYRGHWLAIWILVFLVGSKLFMGVNVSGLNPWVTTEFVLTKADAIPLGSYAEDAASVVVFMFSAWGLALLTLSLLGLVVLIRYRAMIPLMFLLLMIEQLGRKALGILHPILGRPEAEGVSTGLLINWAFSVLLVFGFLLSLFGARK